LLSQEAKVVDIQEQGHHGVIVYMQIKVAILKVVVEEEEEILVLGANQIVLPMVTVLEEEMGKFDLGIQIHKDLVGELGGMVEMDISITK
jgi:predicted aconitase with swiveling domain